MTERNRTPIRVLVVDDDAEVRNAYRQVLLDSEPHRGTSAFSKLRSQLFSGSGSDSAQHQGTAFDPVFCDQAQAAVAAVREALAEGQPFAVAFLDMRMPPGNDGAWAAARIREMDPTVELVICTAYSDADPRDIGVAVPPEDKLSYLQKPFHPHEVRQMTIALASKWRAEQRIVRLATFDMLTGLPNRVQAATRLDSAVAAAKQRGKMLGVLCLDIDNFKRVNDTLGHAIGDQLLCMVATRLDGFLRGGGTVDWATSTSVRQGDLARLGGDEFLVLIPAVKSLDDATLAAERLIREIREPMQFESNSVVVTPSVGIALYPQHGADAATLLRNADLALYLAKRRGPGTYASYEDTLEAVALQRFKIEDRLRSALERHEFSLHYQPQFDLRTGRISGVEALLRWNSKELGTVPPSEFIPIAEETGLILAIGDWALRQACRQAKVWCDDGLFHGRMAVNVSSRQFSLPDYPRQVAAILEETGLDPAMLELEITESVVLADEKWALQAINQLKEIGSSLAIDDFGTGYSSFDRLRHLPVDRLKIDRSFVTSIDEGSDYRAIAAAIIAMSRSLHVKVTAEGVENVPQLMFLEEHDCQDAQGFLLSKALPADEVRELLRRVAEFKDGSLSQRVRALRA